MADEQIIQSTGQGAEVVAQLPPQSQNITKWQTVVPWLATLTSYGALVTIGIFLVVNIQGIRELVLPPGSVMTEVAFYTRIDFYAVTFLKSVGVFSAMCLIFLGMSISLFVSVHATRLGVENERNKISLLTHSPGIIAVVLGVALMIVVLTFSTSTSLDNAEGKFAMGPTSSIDRTVQLEE